jgi:hypothetical protein
MHEIKYTCFQGLKYILGDGKKIRFWFDVWLGECPLKIRFNNLFEISREQKWMVSKVLEGGGGRINLSFRSRFGDRESLEWEELEECLSRVHLSEDKDNIWWALTKNGQFSVALLYKHCASSGVTNVRMEEMWNERNTSESVKFLMADILGENLDNR